MRCSIADVYDAMRSQRAYQQAFPSERILQVLKRNDGTQFDQHLVRRFVQLIGIYPPGNLVRLNTGEVAVVLKVYAPDPYRPQVRVLISRDCRCRDVPCHRVIAAGGRIGGYGGSEMLKRSLLAAEGIIVSGLRIRDLDRTLWRPRR